jgi:osmotically-inducible protein OsmY
MSHLTRPGLTLALLACTLPACSIYDVGKKCGLRGCQGDAAITKDVVARFGDYPSLQPPNLLHVQTLDHVVYLSGEVNTDLERDLAESVARQVPGVAHVMDSINTEYQGH